jgi:excisionase family DNA binding protein
MEGQKLIKIKQASEMLGVSENTLRSWAKRGVLRAFQIRKGLHRRFRAEDIEKLKREFGI